MHGVDVTCAPMASKEDPQLNRAKSVVEFLGTPSPSEKPDSQTDFSAPGQRRTIPRVQVSLVLSICYTYIIGSPCIIAFILRYIRICIHTTIPNSSVKKGPKGITLVL